MPFIVLARERALKENFRIGTDNILCDKWESRNIMGFNMFVVEPMNFPCCLHTRLISCIVSCLALMCSSTSQQNQVDASTATTKFKFRFPLALASVCDFATFFEFMSTPTPNTSRGTCDRLETFGPHPASSSVKPGFEEHCRQKSPSSYL